jgi:hypothetical protein
MKPDEYKLKVTGEPVEGKPSTTAFDDDFYRIKLDPSIADELEQDLSDSEAEHSEQISKWDDYDALYNNEIPDTNEPWKDSFNTNIPIAIYTVNNALSRTSLAIEETQPPIIVEPLRYDSMETKIARQRQDFLKYQTEYEIPNYRRNKYGIYGDAFRYGTGIGKLTWDRQQQQGRFTQDYTDLESLYSDFPDIETEYPDILRKFEKEGAVRMAVRRVFDSYLGVRIDRVSPKNFLPGMQDLNGIGRFVGAEKLDLTYRQLEWMAAQKQIQNWEEVQKKYDPKDKTKLDIWYGVWNLPLKKNDNGLETTDGHIPEKVIITFDRDNNTILDSKAYFYEHQRTFWIPYYCFPDADSFWGRGKIEQVFYLNCVMNAIFNQTLDASALANSKVFKVRQNSLIDKLRPKFKPGAYFPIQLQDDITELLQSDVKPSSFQLISVIQAMVERTTTQSSYSAGQEKMSDPRASGEKVKALLGQSQVQVNDDISHLQEGNKEMAFQMSELYGQFLTEDAEYRITGRNDQQAFGEMAPADLRKRMIYVPKGSGVNANREMELRMNMTLLDMMTQNPVLQEMFAMLPNSIRNQVDEILTLLGKKNKNDILPTEEQIQAEMKRRVDEQMAQQLQQVSAERDKAVSILKRISKPQGQPQGQRPPMNRQPQRPQRQIMQPKRQMPIVNPQNRGMR